MPLDEQFCMKLILSMDQMDRFPRNEHSLSRLVEKLQKADDERMAKDIIDGFVDSASHETRCPMPGDIASEVHKRMTERYGDFLPDPECVPCEGTGFVRVLMSDGMPGSGPRCECVQRRKPRIRQNPTESTSELEAQKEEWHGLNSFLQKVVDSKGEKAIIVRDGDRKDSAEAAGRLRE